MLYDIKTYSNLVADAVLPKNSRISRTAPFLAIKNGDNYVCSKLYVTADDNEHTYTKSYDFTFEFEGLEIEKANVSKIDFFQASSDGLYHRVILDTGVILTSEEMADFILILYTETKNDKTSIYQSYNLFIYDNSGLIGNIKKVKSLIDINTIDKKKVFFYRRFNDDYSWCGYDERWVYTSGKEYSENQLNLSLCEWNKLFQPHSNSFWNIADLYSNDNEKPLDSERLTWDSNDLCKWQCALGHSWMATVKDLTQRRSYCPICSEHISGFSYNTEERRAQKTYNQVLTAQAEFKTNDIAIIKNYVNEELAEFQEMRDMGILWFDHGKMPDSITFYFAFPNGKHGDIDKAICEGFGEVAQMDDFTYKAILSTDHFEEIELLSESYADKTLLQNLDNSELNRFLYRHNVMHRLHFLSSLAHNFNMSSQTVFAIDRNMTQYRAPLRTKRMQIYNDIVGENKATQKWTSEQLLFHIVKAIYADAIFQYKTDWLGHQSLDIYIPSLRVGIEYQGKQHYEAVTLFGGEQGFKERILLDERKRRLCTENKITLLEWKYTEEINEDSVRLFLNKVR